MTKRIAGMGSAIMIEAPDSVINGHMSLCLTKPFPLQYEKEVAYRGGFPQAEDKLRAYYGCLGFTPCRDGHSDHY